VLSAGKCSATICDRRTTQPDHAVSKLLRVLREAEPLTSRVDKQHRRYLLRPAPLAEVDAWLAPYRRFWAARLDALQAHLDPEQP
jgi:hypothetical protein